MELSWPMRLRIAAAVAVGVVLIGLLAWPLASPPEPFGAVSLATGSVSLGGAISLAGLAFLAGFVSYFVCWPHGREIGILAVPAGLAVWALRSGSMADLIEQNPALKQRQAVLGALRWEPVFWLAIVAAGFAGVLVAQLILSRTRSDQVQKEGNSKSKPKYLNTVIAVLLTVLIAQFCIRILAQDVRIADRELGSVVAQPTVAQAAFAVFASFGLAAFIAKKLLNASYVWPTVGSSFVTGFAITAYVKQGVLQYLVQQWPAVFFPNAVVSILPVQMVAFGTLGSIAGYWLAVRYGHWPKHA